MRRSYLNRIQVPGFPATVGAMTRREPAQARSRATRDAVLDAASRLAELDPALLQAATIAGEAGIGTGTLYQYFTGVDDVIDAVVRRHLTHFRDLIVSTFDGAAFVDAVQATLGVFDAFVDYYRNEPGFRAVWFDLGRASRLRALDVANHEVLAATMYDELAGRGLIPASPVARTIAMANWELADALIGLAFRIDPDGDDATLAYVRHLLRLASSPTLEVIATMAATMPGR